MNKILAVKYGKQDSLCTVKVTILFTLTLEYYLRKKKSFTLYFTAIG